jgi:D-3-phosphoglycerate dehydrogenase
LKRDVPIVLQTDYAWPDDSVEREIIEAAGHELVSGPSAPGSAGAIEALVIAHQPAAIMTCWAQVSAHAINAPVDLRIVQRVGVGLDNIDVAAASARGAWVANVPDYCVDEVSDHAVALLLDWARGTVAYDRDVKGGRWNPSTARLRRVADLAVGIVGYGRIGLRTGEKLRAFGCRLLIHTRSAPPRVDGEIVSLERLLNESDAVILHAPYTPETHHLIDASRLKAMRKGAFLINVSRGGLVDTDALLVALEDGWLSGAGLDVIEGEPDPPRRLVERADVIVTPHVAFSSEASLIELRRRAAEEVVRVLAGKQPSYPCNTPQGQP